MTVVDVASGDVRVSFSWMENPARACRGAPREIFFPVTIKANGEVDDEAEEPPWPSAEATSFCDRCPVKAECLQWALDTGEPFGIWGGFSGYQRELVSKTRRRRLCPGCDAPDVVTEGANELCLRCGVSWAVL